MPKYRLTFTRTLTLEKTIEAESFEDALKKFKLRFRLVHEFGYSTVKQDDDTYTLVPVVENIDERLFQHEF